MKNGAGSQGIPNLALIDRTSALIERGRGKKKKREKKLKKKKENLACSTSSVTYLEATARTALAALSSWMVNVLFLSYLES